MSGTSRTVISEGMRALGTRAVVDGILNKDDDRYQEGLRLQAGARTLSWVNWWEGRSHVVTDANLMTRLANMQRPIDHQADIGELLRETLGAR